MLITLLAIAIAILFIVLGGLMFNVALHQRDSYRGQRHYHKSQTTQLHEIIFLQH